MTWLDQIKALANDVGLVVLRLGTDQAESLEEARLGLGEFTMAQPHSALNLVRTPTPCLVLCLSAERSQVRFGMILSKKPVTTLESRIKFAHGVAIKPARASALEALLTDPRHSRDFAARLNASADVVRLPPKLATRVVEALAAIGGNQDPMRSVAESLSAPSQYQGSVAQQEDAVRLALAAFGMRTGTRAKKVELSGAKSTALARIPIIEDAAIEQDTRTVPGYSFVRSDVTGRAVFTSQDEQLEVITANRRDLEHCLGVDLVYVNLSKGNVVMLQYKMLAPQPQKSGETDWIYRPDTQLKKEMIRMKAFSRNDRLAANEYRLNPEAFFFKFVKRDARLAAASVITPLKHFELLMSDPAMRGVKGAIRLSYESLRGRYLRQGAFLDLVRGGYIGASAKRGAQLRVLIDSILKGDRAVVAAIQERVSSK